MSAEVAGEVNPGEEASPTSRTEVGKGRDICASRSDFPHLAFLLGMLYTLLP